MSSKKQRKKLKQQYFNKKEQYIFHDYNQVINDRELIMEYFKANPNIIIKSKDIMANINLYDNSQSSISRTIKMINNYSNVFINTIRGSNGGYVYYG